MGRHGGRQAPGRPSARATSSGVASGSSTLNAPVARGLAGRRWRIAARGGARRVSHRSGVPSTHSTPRPPNGLWSSARETARIQSGRFQVLEGVAGDGGWGGWRRGWLGSNEVSPQSDALFGGSPRSTSPPHVGAVSCWVRQSHLREKGILTCSVSPIGSPRRCGVVGTRFWWGLIRVPVLCLADCWRVAKTRRSSNRPRLLGSFAVE